MGVDIPRACRSLQEEFSKKKLKGAFSQAVEEADKAYETAPKPPPSAAPAKVHRKIARCWCVQLSFGDVQ